MRKTILALALLTALILTQSGCATGFRASGPRGGGVSAGAGVGAAPAPVYVQPAGDPLAPPPPASGPPR
jgi:hypothetical protein